MIARIASLGFAGLLLTGLITPTASAGDFSFGLSIGGGRAYYTDAYYAPYYSSCYSPRYVVRDCDYDYGYGYGYAYDCAPVVVRPYRAAYYTNGCYPSYYRSARVYSTRNYYVSPHAHHRSVGVVQGPRGGRAYYRH